MAKEAFAPLKLQPPSDSVVDAAALNLPSGPFGTCINGQTFQQEALVSFNGHQYAAYYAEGGVLSLARRKLPGGAWETIRFEDYVIRHDDVHNVAVVGICPEDGSIHLSYDHHCSPLHYRKSVPGLATTPEKFDWKASCFGATTSELERGKNVGNVTYPQFFSTPQGKLQLLYRQGSSGDGDWHLAEYDPGKGGWRVLGMLFSRQGQFETSASRCAYPNPLRYDRASRLHVTWCWRERPANGMRDLRTNHDLCYAYSDDFGRTWKNNDGRVVALLEPEAPASAITVDTAGVVVRKTKFLWGQMNATTQYIDAKGRVHVINWQHDQDAAGASADLNTWRYYHYWRAADGRWRENILPFVGRKPQIVLDESGNACVVHSRSENRKYHGEDPGGRLTVSVASEKTGWTDWTTAWASDGDFVGEPLLDLSRWDATERVLSIYSQEKPAAKGAASALHVIDMKTENKMNDKYDEADLRRRFDSLGAGHPRLCTRTEVLPTDMGDREAYLQALIVEAQAVEKKPVLERIQEGRRLLHVSREALRRISVLSIAWMRTRDEAFLKRAEAEMLALCAFSDWNPSHYLDTAEMSLAVALGYDWLYNALPAESRDKIADGLWRLGLQTALDDTQGWVKAENNWGQVCHAGMTAAALALAERHPDEAFKVVERAYRNIRLPMEAYAPDGIYPEGPMYWDYGTSFNIVFFMLVESALGTSYDLDGMPGFVDSADFMRYATAPSGYYFNYADCQISRRCNPGLLWFADRFKSRFGGRASGAFEREWNTMVNSPAKLMRSRMAPVILTFGLDAASASRAEDVLLPLDMQGRGISELVMMRGAWNDAAAWYVGIKSGSPSAPHGHMDAGSFIVEAGGVRWADECGMEDYNRLEQMGYNLWNGPQDGLRWDVFKYGNQSHNIIVINGERQQVKQRANVVAADLNGQSPYVKVDLAAMYQRPVAREFNFTKRESLTITDTVSGLSEGDVVRWQMLTPAAATSRGRVLTLTQDGKRMTLEVDDDVAWKVTETRDLYKAWDSPQDNLRVVSFERQAKAAGVMSHRVTFRLAADLPQGVGHRE